MTQGQYTYKIRKSGWLYVFFVFPFYISITALKMEFPTDLVTFTEEILNGKLHFFCAVYILVYALVALCTLCTSL